MRWAVQESRYPCTVLTGLVCFYYEVAPCQDNSMCFKTVHRIPSTLSHRPHSVSLLYLLALLLVNLCQIAFHCFCTTNAGAALMQALFSILIICEPYSSFDYSWCLNTYTINCSEIVLSSFRLYRLSSFLAHLCTWDCTSMRLQELQESMPKIQANKKSAIVLCHWFTWSDSLFKSLCTWRNVLDVLRPQFLSLNSMELLYLKMR